MLYITVKPKYPAFKNNMVLNDVLNISKDISQKQAALIRKFSKKGAYNSNFKKNRTNTL